MVPGFESQPRTVFEAPTWTDARANPLDVKEQYERQLKEWDSS